MLTTAIPVSQRLAEYSWCEMTLAECMLRLYLGWVCCKISVAKLAQR